MHISSCDRPNTDTRWIRRGYVAPWQIEPLETRTCTKWSDDAKERLTLRPHRHCDPDIELVAVDEGVIRVKGDGDLN